MLIGKYNINDIENINIDEIFSPVKKSNINTQFFDEFKNIEKNQRKSTNPENIFDSLDCISTTEFQKVPKISNKDKLDCSKKSKKSKSLKGLSKLTVLLIIIALITSIIMIPKYLNLKSYNLVYSANNNISKIKSILKSFYKNLFTKKIVV